MRRAALRHAVFFQAAVLVINEQNPARFPILVVRAAERAEALRDPPWPAPPASNAQTREVCRSSAHDACSENDPASSALRQAAIPRRRDCPVGNDEMRPKFE